MPLSLASPSFAQMDAIPTLHTCDGEDLAPALAWTQVPAGTKSFVLIVDDPDAPDPAAPTRTFVHWVLYDIPAGASSLPEGATSDELPEGTREGLNDAKRIGYMGPCPPIGRHRYFFKLSALDSTLRDLGNATKADVERAMRGHVLEKAELVGTYERKSGKK
jgi:Raf kinase inhibitor-like YbhB/YbcL family protein